MSADSIGTGGIFCRLTTVAGTMARRVLGLGTAAAFFAGATASAQLPLSGFDASAAPQPAPFSVVPDDDEYTGQVDAIHSPNVDRIMGSQYKLDVARRHSQLIVTNRRVRRIDVTHTDIANFVQYSPTEISVIGMELGTTNLMLWFEGEQTPSIYEVTVIRDENIEEQRRIDFGRLERRLAQMFPNSNVYLTPIGLQVHVRGQAYDSEEADQILQIVRTEVVRSYGRYGDLYNQTGFAGAGGGIGNLGGGFNQQLNGAGGGGLNDIIVNDLSIPGAFNVMLRVVIAEINRSQAREANIDLNVAFRNGRHAFNSVLGAAAAGANVGGVYENGEIQAIVRWLATNGTINLVAEPRIVTLSGHPASLLGGGEFAVPTIIGLGGGQNTTFRGVGTSMIVTPTILDRDDIRLQVQAEHSAINNGNSVNGIPGTDAKRIETVVQLREGQTLAIGGLISRQTTSTVSRIPLLGSIPYIGTRLFHSKSAQEGDTELLILVSPEIVNPMEPDEVPPLPNFYVTHPNDHDLCKYGRTEGNPDQNVYQTQPYGSGNTHGIPQGYSLFNPPVNGPGFQPGLGGMVPSQNLTPSPQSEYSLPPANTMHHQSSPPAGINQYQQQAPMSVQPPQMAPPAVSPQTPLPPVPQQTSWNSIQEPKKQGFADRFNALFQKKPKNNSGNPVSTVGWRR